MVRVPLREYWRLLARYLSPDFALLGVLAALLLSDVFVRLVTPWLAGRFIDDATSAHPGSGVLGGLLVLAAAYLVAGVVDQALTVATTHLGAHISWRATNRLREDAVGHCLQLDMTFHHRHAPGVMVERLDGDVRQLNNFFAEFALRVLGNVLLVVAVLVVVFVDEWRIGLVFAGFSLVALFVLNRVRGVSSPHWQRSREANAALYGEVEERFGGIADIRPNGAAGYVLRRFADRLRAEFRLTRRATAVSVGVSQGAGLVMAFAGVAILAVSVVMYRNGSISLGTVVAMVLYTGMISAPLREIIGQVDDLQRATASIARVQELMSTQPTVTAGPGVPWRPGPLPVAFENVTFFYPTDPDADRGDRPALREVTFDLRPGEVLGLVGRTGAGKSTIARLLLRFYDPAIGRITIDGADIRDATLDQLRRHVGVVTQEVQLFGASVRDNLALFDPDIPDRRLTSVLDEVGLGDWFRRQPAGLDTMLSADGAGLSAGQAQLLGVARIFVADPGIVVLDEPTSRVDPGTEKLIDAAFDRLLVGRTGVIVAHRLQTLHRVDTVMIVRDGGVAEYGPRADLAADLRSEFHQALVRGGLEAVS